MRSLTLALVITVMLMTASGCGQAHDHSQVPPTQPQRFQSGIRGTTTVDTLCRPTGAGPCPRRPLSAVLIITPAGAQALPTRAESGPDGRFRVPLPAGRYAIQPRNLTGATVPTAYPFSVTIRPGAWITISIHFDSGIR